MEEAPVGRDCGGTRPEPRCGAQRRGARPLGEPSGADRTPVCSSDESQCRSVDGVAALVISDAALGLTVRDAAARATAACAEHRTGDYGERGLPPELRGGDARRGAFDGRAIAVGTLRAPGAATSVRAACCTGGSGTSCALARSRSSGSRSSYPRGSDAVRIPNVDDIRNRRRGSEARGARLRRAQPPGVRPY